ncbi:MAG: Metal transporter permease, partial [Chloroflexi bacterium]|nr:Metal transporter permease [Chloroflexota bacterium]
LLTDSFAGMLWRATLIGALCRLAGVYASYYLDIASGATIVLVAAGLFVLTLGATTVIGRRSLAS